MFCIKCGAEVQATDKFCHKCGAPQKSNVNTDTAPKTDADPAVLREKASDTSEPVQKKNRMLPVFLLSGLLLIVIGVLIFLIFASGGTGKKYDEQLKLAERYLDELDYDKAIAAYKKAISIDPEKPEAYLGLAEVYVAKEEYQKAIDVLEDGYDKTGDERLADKITEIEALMKAKLQPAEEATPGVPEDDEQGEPEPTVEPERVWQEISVDSIPEKEQLDDFLQRSIWHKKADYDFSNPVPANIADSEVCSVIDWIMGPVPGVPHSIYPIDQPEESWDWDKPPIDPLGKFEMAQVWKEESINWIMENIYNLDRKGRERMKQKWIEDAGDGSYAYYYDGLYCTFIGGIGGPQTAEVKKAYYDGVQYKIVYVFLDDFEYGKEYERYEALMELKTIDGKKYWSIYKREKISE